MSVFNEIRKEKLVPGLHITGSVVKYPFKIFGFLKLFLTALHVKYLQSHL